MRCKLICGYRRSEIYLSFFFITSAAGLAVTGTWLLLNLVLGIPLLGMPGLSSGELAGYIVCDLLMTVALASVCNLIGSLSASETKGILMNLAVCSLAVILVTCLAGLYAFRKKDIP